MKSFLTLPIVFLLLLSPQVTLASDCDVNCGKKCCTKVLGATVCEPGCKAACEHERDRCKRATGIIESSCARDFTRVKNAILLTTGSQATNTSQVSQAVSDLIAAGIVPESRFKNVKYRWCNLNGDTKGMVPDRNLVCIDESMKGKNRVEFATLMAHEMKHVEQYGSMGTNSFKCEYTKHYLACGGCQDDGHPMEKAANRFEAKAEAKLTAWFRAKSHVRSTIQITDTQPNTYSFTFQFERDGARTFVSLKEPCGGFLNGRDYGMFLTSSKPSVGLQHANGCTVFASGTITARNVQAITHYYFNGYLQTTDSTRDNFQNLLVGIDGSPL